MSAQSPMHASLQVTHRSLVLGTQTVDIVLDALQGPTLALAGRWSQLGRSSEKLTGSLVNVADDVDLGAGSNLSVALLETEAVAEPVAAALHKVQNSDGAPRCQLCQSDALELATRDEASVLAVAEPLALVAGVRKRLVVLASGLVVSDVQGAAAELGAVHRVQSLRRLVSAQEGDEAVAARATTLITHDAGVDDLAEGREGVTEEGTGNVPIEVLSSAENSQT